MYDSLLKEVKEISNYLFDFVVIFTGNFLDSNTTMFKFR